MVTSTFWLLVSACGLSLYLYGAVWLRLNDTCRDLPRWVPLVWPVLLPVAYAWLLLGRTFGRMA